MTVNGIDIGKALAEMITYDSINEALIYNFGATYDSTNEAIII